MRDQSLSMRRSDKESKYQERDKSPITTLSNTKLNTFLKFIKIDTLNMFQLTEFKRELNTKQLRDKSFTNPNNKSFNNHLSNQLLLNQLWFNPPTFSPPSLNLPTFNLPTLNLPTFNQLTLPLPLNHYKEFAPWPKPKEQDLSNPNHPILYNKYKINNIIK